MREHCPLSFSTHLRSGIEWTLFVHSLLTWVRTCTIVTHTNFWKFAYAWLTSPLGPIRYSISNWLHVIISDEDCLPPPVLHLSQDEPPIMDFHSEAKLSEQQCREALQSHIQGKICYGKKCAMEMTIKKVLPSSALHVRKHWSIRRHLE